MSSCRFSHPSTSHRLAACISVHRTYNILVHSFPFIITTYPLYLPMASVYNRLSKHGSENAPFQSRSTKYETYDWHRICQRATEIMPNELRKELQSCRWIGEKHGLDPAAFGDEATRRSG
ncbi:hypothetical protein C364_02549 [Cryptococcus neoformans Bt63]|nr:hypothetical protein C364_02549 [Cryptococcus neoformans var. grubii Bt63]